jgi:hypothetical protein
MLIQDGHAASHTDVNSMTVTLIASGLSCRLGEVSVCRVFRVGPFASRSAKHHRPKA